MVRDRGIKAERRGKRDGERDKKNPEGREETFCAGKEEGAVRLPCVSV